ncbi:hypothetical protein Hanom_Chr08g00746421 [Helianthus anomalus]
MNLDSGYYSDMQGDDLDYDPTLVDPLVGHIYLEFPGGSRRYRRCKKLRTMEIGAHERINGEAVMVRDIIRLDSRFLRLFQTALEDSYRELTVEFISTFIYQPHPADYVEDPDHVVHEITFRLAGQEFGMSLRQFAVHSGLYTAVELDTDIYMQGVTTLDRQTLISF